MRSCVVLLLTLFFHASCVCGQTASTADSPSPDRSIHDWIVQWRENPNDAVYNAPGFLIRAADYGRARFVGHRPGTQIRWQANLHLWFQVDHGILYAGRFLKETQPGPNLNYWALWAGYKF